AIYIPGGRPERANLTPTNRTFFFQLSPQARHEAERSWEAIQRAHTNSVLASEMTTPQPSAGRQLTYMAETRLPADAAPGFVTVTEARARSAGKPLVLYFTLPNAQPCQEQ